MEKFRAVMITDFNNPKSVAYKDVSMETWKKVSNVEVEPWQCYTPETMKESDHWPRMRWEPNLKSSAGKYKDVGHTITPTEQACLTSMYHWWEHILHTHERVIKTLRDWKIRIDESLFLGGLEKRDFLKDFGADIFFDDQIENCLAASLEVPTGQVINFNSRN